jgi:peptide/nickel transport system ATP-binding protein
MDQAEMKPLLDVKDLSVHFPLGRGGFLGKPAKVLKAVDGVTFQIGHGETLGLVGESGSGKTTLGRAVLRGIEPSGGTVTIHLDGSDVEITSLERPALRGAWRQMQLIFQDPYSSLNPRMTVQEIIAEPLVVHGISKGQELKDRVFDIAQKCGLDVSYLRRYPHAFSGGQRQRIAIARALVLEPKIVICDEPVSALDVSIQAQILNLLKDLQRQLGLTYLFIAHDLAAVAYACDRVAVMYLGQLVEVAPTDRLYYAPKHPYTEALMSAIPEANPDAVMRPVLLSGERPNPAEPPAGCRFHTRCRYADEQCRVAMPPLKETAPGHLAACHYAERLDLKGALDYGAAPGGRGLSNPDPGET